MAPNQVIGCLQTPGAMLRFALRGFFFGKKSFKQNNAYLLQNDIFMCFSKKTSVVYHDQGHDQGHDHDLDHDHDLGHDLDHDLDHDEDEKKRMKRRMKKRRMNYYVLCTLYFVLCTLYSALCTLYSVLCTLYSVLCTKL